MKAKTDWKTIAQPWILGCLFPLSWRSKGKIISKERLKPASFRKTPRFALSITQKKTQKSPLNFPQVRAGVPRWVKVSLPFSSSHFSIPPGSIHLYPGGSGGAGPTGQEKAAEQPRGSFSCCYTEFHLHKSHFGFGAVTAASIGSA